MGELRAALKPITDLAMVCTEKQFADMCSEDNSLLEKEYVYLSSVQIVGIKLKSDKVHTVRSVWERACRYVGYDEADYPDFGEAIRGKSTGTLLKNLPD